MSNKPKTLTYKTINNLARKLLKDLEKKDFILLYAYNGTGKTRLSMEFKDIGKNSGERDTLYFNAFTEDLFSWDNDLDGDSHRMLYFKESHFFDGLEELEMESRIRPFLHRYADFDFTIDYTNRTITFERDDDVAFKVSRGEENIFIWCFFLAVAQLAIDGQEAYDWVKYLYIDDPVSSLDDNHAIAVASHLAQLLKQEHNKVKTVISSHHTLFFNVIWNELRKSNSYFLCKYEGVAKYLLRNTGDTPSFHHVAILKELFRAVKKGKLYTYHFNMLRNILEKTATFHGYNKFSDCIQQEPDDIDGIVHARIINILSHGNYSIFEPIDMVPENKNYFKKILDNFMSNYRFNPELFPEQITQGNQS